MEKSNQSSRTSNGSSSVPNSPKGITPLRNVLHRASTLPHPQPSIPLAAPKPRRTTPAVGILDLVTEHLKGTPPPFVRQSSPMLTNPNNIISRLNMSNLTSRVSIERVSTASPEYPINQDSDGVAADYSVTILTELIGAPYLGDRTSEAAITALTGKQASFRVSKDDHDITMNNFRRSISLESLATKASTTPCMLPMPSSRPYYDLSDSLESIPQHAWVMPYIVACTPPEILGQLLDIPFLVEGMSNTPAALVVAARLRARTISYDTAPTIDHIHNSTSNTTDNTTTVHRTTRSSTSSAEPPAYIPQSINNIDDKTSDDRNIITRRRSSTHTGAVYQPDYVLPADYYTTHIRTPSQQLFKIQLNHNITSSSNTATASSSNTATASSSNTATASSSSSSRDPFAVHNKNIVSNTVTTSSASNSASNSIAVENNELDIKTHSLQPLPKHKLSTTLPYRGSSKTPPPLQPQRVKFPNTWRSLGTVWLSQDPKWGSWNPKIVFLLDNYLLECTPTGTAVVGYTQLTNAKIVKIALGDTHGIGRRHTRNSSGSSGGSGNSSSMHKSYSTTRLATTTTGIRGGSGSGNIHQVVAIEPPLLPRYYPNNATTSNTGTSNSNSPTGFELTTEPALPLNTTSIPTQQQPPSSPANRETSPSPMYGIKITCAATSNPTPITAQSNTHTFWLTASNEYALDQIVLALTTAASLTMEDVFEVQRSAEDENIALLGRGRFNEVRLARRQLTRNLFQPPCSATTSAQPSALNSPRQYSTTTADVLPVDVRSSSSTNAPDYLVPDPFTTTSTVSNSSTHSPTTTSAGVAEMNTFTTTAATTTTTHYLNRSDDGFDSPDQSSFISVSSTDDAEQQQQQQPLLQLHSPHQKQGEDVFACRNSARKIQRDSLDSPDLRCSNSRIQDYHHHSSTAANPFATTSNPFSAPSTDVNPFSTTSNPFSASSLEPANPFSASSLEPTNPFSVPSLLQYSSSNQNSPAERYDSALPKLNLSRALERVDTEGFPLSDCDRSSSSSSSSSDSSSAAAENTSSSSTAAATTDMILPHTDEETNDRFSGWELQYCCALKVVSKEIFWGRVQTGRERGDALVREVLAQMLIATHYADHPKLILHSEYNVQPYLNKYEYNSHSNNTSMVVEGQYNEQTTRDIGNTEIEEKGNTETRDTGNTLPTTTTTTTATTTTTPHRHLPIVQLLSAFETPQGFAIELQLMQSIDLFDLLSEVGVLPEYHVQCIIAQLIEAVSLCNTLGIAHRDIKLSNICFSMYQYNSHSVQSLLQSKTPIKIHLADFGMSGFIGSDKQLRGRCGTPGYVAPDILNADTNASYGLNIDIFSIAVVAYTLLCGYEPFGGSDTQELLRANRAAEYKFHSPEWDGVSAAAKDWIAAALQPTTTSRISIEKSKEHDWLVGYFSGTSSGGSSSSTTAGIEKDSNETHSCILC